MWVFTAHMPGQNEAPLVAVFDDVPTVDEIAEQFCNTVPELEIMPITISMNGVGIDRMPANVKKALTARAAAGEWPSVGKLSDDGWMFFSMQMIVDRPKDRN